MSERAIDPAYLRYQYGDSKKLRIRIEAHERYSERGGWAERVLSHIALKPGQLVLDVGCGHGSWHRRLIEHGVCIVGVDASMGMAKEARQQAVERGWPVEAVQGDAQALPLRDASCDRVLAAHVLFHVPDRLKALQEMRRVSRPGGRVVLTSNAADHIWRLKELHAEVARELGYTPAAPAGVLFTLDDLPLVRSVFPNAERHVFENAFLFPTVEAALPYYASVHVDAIVERADDGSHRPPLLAAMRRCIQSIIETEGVFRVPKNSGCFVAEV